MGDERTSVGKVFVEYVIINKARNEGIPLEELAWGEEARGASGNGEPDRLVPLHIRSGQGQYIEHFLEDEIRHCLTRPQCFNAVERKISYLFGRIRKDRPAVARQSRFPAAFSSPTRL